MYAREEDCALGRERLSKIERGWRRFTEASYIVMNIIKICKWMLGGVGARPRLGVRSRP